MTRDQLTVAPEYAEGKPIIAIGATGDLRPLIFPPPRHRRNDLRAQPYLVDNIGRVREHRRPDG